MNFVHLPAGEIPSAYIHWIQTRWISATVIYDTNRLLRIIGKNKIILNESPTTTHGILTPTATIYVANINDAIAATKKYRLTDEIVILSDKDPSWSLNIPGFEYVYTRDRNCSLSQWYKECKSSCVYYKYNVNNSAELKYIELLRELMRAPERPNRTNTGTRGVFHRTLRFPLQDSRGPILPLLTSKKMPIKTIIHELIWFLRGSTSTEYLKKNSVRIWDDNASAESIKKRGLDYPEGVLGPIYGHQWRNWGATVDNSNSYDQIKILIEEIKTNPSSRRLLVSAWNVADLNKMVLPPCHYSFQFYVDFAAGSLSCLVNMRSADVALGVPFNIASYSILTHIIAKITNLAPGELVISMGDCHIYSNHIDGIKEQLNHSVNRFPTFEFAPRTQPDIDWFTHQSSPDDYIIKDYYPADPIKFPMSI